MCVGKHVPFVYEQCTWQTNIAAAAGLQQHHHRTLTRKHVSVRFTLTSVGDRYNRNILEYFKKLLNAACSESSQDKHWQQLKGPVVATV